MTTATTTLTSFLLDRIQEDEEAARAALSVRNAPWAAAHLIEDNGAVTVASEAFWFAGAEPWRESELTAHIARHDPARVLAECESKRAIVALHDYDEIEFCGQHQPELHCSTCGSSGEYGVPWPCATLRALALPFADHPEFRSEWNA